MFYCIADLSESIEISTFTDNAQQGNEEDETKQQTPECNVKWPKKVVTVVMV